MIQPASSISSLDAAVIEAVRDALAQSGNSWLKSLDVSACEDFVVLKGQVPSFYLKQLAFVTASRVPGVLLFRNELEVGQR
jgi:osmotically-inducible protein OsmY